MNLDNLVTQDQADAGIWVPVELYGKKQDFDLLILGDDSNVVQQYQRKAAKKLNLGVGKNDKSFELDDEAIDELLETGNEAVLIRIAGIRGWKVERSGLVMQKEISRTPEPVTLDGEELKNDTASYRKLITKIPALKDFVLKVSRDRTNFLSQPSGN